MPKHIHPLWCSPKLTGLVFYSSPFYLGGCSSAGLDPPSDGNYRIVQRVIDGDTLVVDNGERVRLIGVDTPETKHPGKPVERFGKQAAAFTRRMVEGKRVRLEFDPANAPREHRFKRVHPASQRGSGLF
jgi:endonuclease YncB( thermonuclease family)